MGAFVVAFGRAMGFRIVAVDAGKEKGEYALAQGADAYVDITDPAVTDAEGGVGAAVKAVTTDGLGAVAVVVCAGVGAAYSAALEMLAPFGTLMCLGIPPPPQSFAVHPLWFIQYGYRIMGSAVGTRRDTLEALEFVSRGLVKPIVQQAELSNLSELMEDVVKGKVSFYLLGGSVSIQHVTDYVITGAREVRDKSREYLKARTGGDLPTSMRQDTELIMVFKKRNLERTLDWYGGTILYWNNIRILLTISQRPLPQTADALQAQSAAETHT